LQLVPLVPPDLSAIAVPDEWLELAERLPNRGRMLVLGPTDSGKTTFCWWLAEELSAQGKVVVVDADVGQSRVGPPACVGWVGYGSTQGEFEFVGDVSPAKRPAVVLAATVRMALRAQRLAKPDWLLVDTTGWVDGPGATQLKTAKAQLLSPVTLVALAPRGRLDHLRWPWRGRNQVRWLRLDTPAECSDKSVEERRSWRQRLFAQQLSGAESREFALDHLALHYVPPAGVLRRWQATGRTRGLLCGLDDEHGVGLGLGLIEEIDVDRTYARVLTRVDPSLVRGLRFGGLRCNPDGTPLEQEEPEEWQENS